MRRIWIGVSLSVALLAFYPAWTGRTSWLIPGIAFLIFIVFLLEPWFLTWELRKRGEALQITDEGVLRRLARGDSEFVRWSDLREVSIVMTQGVNLVRGILLRARRHRHVGSAGRPGARHEVRPAVAPGQTTRLRSPQHRRGHGVAGEPALHVVARGAARGRGGGSAASRAELATPLRTSSRPCA